MSSFRLNVAFLSVSLCIIVLTAAYATYYGQVFQPSPLLNTNLKFWTNDPITNITKPYLWELDLIKGTTDNISIYPINYEGRQSMATRIIRPENSSTVWATVHVRQDLRGSGLSAILRSRISLWVYPTFQYWYDQNSKNPEGAFGIEINDGTNLIWYVFADAPGQVFQLPHHRIVLVQAPLNEWSLREIDIADQYRQSGWDNPESLSFILIMGVTSGHPGNWVGYFSGLRVDVGPLQTQPLSFTQQLQLLLADIFIIGGLLAVTAIASRRRPYSDAHGPKRRRK